MWLSRVLRVKGATRSIYRLECLHVDKGDYNQVFYIKKIGLSIKSWSCTMTNRSNSTSSLLFWGVERTCNYCLRCSVIWKRVYAELLVVVIAASSDNRNVSEIAVIMAADYEARRWKYTAVVAIGSNSNYITRARGRSSCRQFVVELLKVISASLRFIVIHWYYFSTGITTPKDLSAGFKCCCSEGFNITDLVFGIIIIV